MWAVIGVQNTNEQGQSTLGEATRVMEENQESKETKCSANRFIKLIGKQGQAITPTLPNQPSGDAAAFLIAAFRAGILPLDNFSRTFHKSS